MTGETPAKAKSDLAVRTVSGVVMIAVALTCLWVGGWLFTLLLAFGAGIMANEWKRLARGSLGLQLAGIPYILIPITSLLVLRLQPEHAFALTLWTLVIVWATDIGAYFAGRTFGGPKIAPAISPSKTWSGLCGGIVAAASVGWLVAYQASLPPLCLWLGGALAVLAQAGDFFESWLKRRAGVKDSGMLLPGHGGLLDRVDGVVPVASFMGLMLWTGLL